MGNRSTVVTEADRGLSLAPFRGLRPTPGPDRLGGLLCPPYDVIDDAERAALLKQDPDNMVAVVLPQPAGLPGTYREAAQRLDTWLNTGLLRVDQDAAIYVYEMRTADGHRTRGLLGALELRDPLDGVILPHEDTMAGPIADRLALMSATQANLEPIYLVYDGGGAASRVVESIDAVEPTAQAVTPDGLQHRLWAVTDPATHAQIAGDLVTRHALIADGHHRYATYRELQRQTRAERGAGPWDRGLALLVDTATYGPQVHPIHRVLTGLAMDEAMRRAQRLATVTPAGDPSTALSDIEAFDGFAVVLTDGSSTAVLTMPTEPDEATDDGSRPGELRDLDVTRVHQDLVRTAWDVPDTPDHVDYAHSVDEAIVKARASGGTAILMRATPVRAVAAIAAAGLRMPRKSTLFTPKPASGMVMRRFVDDQF